MASRYLLDPSSMFCYGHLLIAASVEAFKARHLSRHLYLSRITEHLYICSARFSLHFLDLSQSLRAFSHSKLLSHTPNFISKRFSALIKFFFTWQVSETLIFMHFMIFNLSFRVFEKVLGFFKIDEVIVKFLGWFL